MKKLIINIFIFIFIVMIFVNNVYALDPNSFKPSDMQGGDTLINKGNIIIGGIQVLGSAVSIIALIVMGIKYVVGSLEEKAQYKKTMLPYLIGAIFVFATSNIVNIIYNATTNFR